MGGWKSMPPDTLVAVRFDRTSTASCRACSEVYGLPGAHGLIGGYLKGVFGVNARRRAACSSGSTSIRRDISWESSAAPSDQPCEIALSDGPNGKAKRPHGWFAGEWIDGNINVQGKLRGHWIAAEERKGLFHGIWGMRCSEASASAPFMRATGAAGIRGPFFMAGNRVARPATDSGVKCLLRRLDDGTEYGRGGPPRYCPIRESLRFRRNRRPSLRLPHDKSSSRHVPWFEVSSQKPSSLPAATGSDRERPRALSGCPGAPGTDTRIPPGAIFTLAGPARTENAPRDSPRRLCAPETRIGAPLERRAAVRLGLRKAPRAAGRIRRRP